MRNVKYIKVQILWEGHKIWKNLPPVLTKQLFLLSSVKTSGRFFQIFVAFSEKLDFTPENMRLNIPLIAVRRVRFYGDKKGTHLTNNCTKECSDQI